MIRIAVVEDEKEIAQQLCSYIERYKAEMGEEYELSVFDDGLDFISDYRPLYDVVFMDIEMPNLDGMKTAQKLRDIDKNICLVFVTKMAQYAIKGYEVEAMGFLLKPVSYYAFSLQLTKALALSRSKAGASISVKDGENIRRILIDDIYYIEISGTSMLFNTASGVIETKGRLWMVAEKLTGMNFAYCNKCYLVNLKYVTEINANNVVVGGSRLTISKRRRKEFAKQFADYIGGSV